MTVVQLVNLALLKIGQSKGIGTLSDEAQEAWTGELIYDHMLRATLRAFPWPFATKYADLYLVQGPAWNTDTDDILVQAWSSTATYAIGDIVVSGDTLYYALTAHAGSMPPNATNWTTTATERANNDWLYAYRWPTDCLFARRMTDPGVGRQFSRTPIEWRVGRDVNGLLLYTNQPAANLEYTMIDCDALWANDIWLNAFTWRLAAEMAPSMAKDDKMHTKCMTMFHLVLNEASTVDSREQQQFTNGDAEWIEGR